MLSAATRDKLKTVSTATICTALFKRGFRNQYIQDVRPLNPAAAPMVGEAFTLRYIPAREDLNPISVFQDRSHPQRKAVEECPPGAVFVIDSRKDARAASAATSSARCAGITTTPSPSPTTTSRGNTGASPQPIGTSMSSAWCTVRLVGAAGR